MKKEKRRVLKNMQAMILHRENKDEVFKPVKVKVALTDEQKAENKKFKSGNLSGQLPHRAEEELLVLPNGYEAEKYIKKLQNVDKPAEYAIWIRWKTLSVTPKIQLTIEEVFE